jgi:hypothetical protein
MVADYCTVLANLAIDFVNDRGREGERTGNSDKAFVVCLLAPRLHSA